MMDCRTLSLPVILCFLKLLGHENLVSEEGNIFQLSCTYKSVCVCVCGGLLKKHIFTPLPYDPKILTFNVKSGVGPRNLHY